MDFNTTVDFNVGDEVWFINHYFPNNRRPYVTYKVRKGILSKVIPNVKTIASDRKNHFANMYALCNKGFTELFL